MEPYFERLGSSSISTITDMRDLRRFEVLPSTQDAMYP